MWETGSIVYLWSSVLIFFVIFIFYKYFQDDSSIKNIFIKVFFPVLTFIAGMSSENTSGGAILLITAMLARKIYNKKRIPLIYIVSYIFMIMGYALLLVAPGNEQRTIATLGKNYYDQSLLYRVFTGAVKVTLAVQNELLVLISILIFLLLIKFFFFFDKEDFVKEMSLSIVGFLTLYALSFSPMGQGGRCLTGASLFFIVAISDILGSIYEYEVEDKQMSKFKNFFSATAIVFLISFTTLMGIIGSSDIYNNFKAVSARNNIVQKAKKSNKKHIKLSALPIPRTKYNSMYALEDIGKNEKKFPNFEYDRYYHVKVSLK